MSKPDILDILGISAREDSIVNIIEHLFNNNEEFKKGFMRAIGGDGESEKDAIIKVREKIEVPGDVLEEERKVFNRIPDITIQFSGEPRYIVEVKIYAKEGKNQLEDYTKIAKYYSRNGNACEVVYLTVNDESEEKGVKSLSWESLYEYISGIKMKDNSIDKILYEVLIDRIKPNDGELKTVEQILNSKNWQTIDMVFEKIIPDEIKNHFKIESFYSFDKSTQRTIGTLTISPSSEKKNWRGETLDKRIDFYSTYDFHIEIRVIVYSEEICVDARLDLHTNPYVSVPNMKARVNNNIIDEKQVSTYYEERHRFIKMEKVRNIERPKNTKYSSSRNSFLYLFKNQNPTTFSKSDSISKVSEYLNDTIHEYYKFGKKFVEIFHEEKRKHEENL